MGDRLVSIYLQDHMAGARVGTELARRVLAQNADTPYEAELADVCADIEKDREVLSDVMSRLDVSGSAVKEGAAWLGEKVGRLKLNGRVAGYSPLSRLVEIEGLVVGVSGKIELWRSLRVARGSDPRLEGVDLKRMIRRGEDQRKRLEKLHQLAAAEALDADPA